MQTRISFHCISSLSILKLCRCSSHSFHRGFKTLLSKPMRRKTVKKRLFLRKIDGQEVVGDQSRARSTKAAAQVAARLDKGRLQTLLVRTLASLPVGKVGVRLGPLGGGFPFPLSTRPPLLLLVPLAPKGTEGVTRILSTMCAATVVTVLNTRTSTGSTSETFLTLNRGATRKESWTGSACTRQSARPLHF